MGEGWGGLEAWAGGATHTWALLSLNLPPPPPLCHAGHRAAQSAAETDPPSVHVGTGAWRCPSRLRARSAAQHSTALRSAPRQLCNRIKLVCCTFHLRIQRETASWALIEPKLSVAVRDAARITVKHLSGHGCKLASPQRQQKESTGSSWSVARCAVCLCHCWKLGVVVVSTAR